MLSTEMLPSGGDGQIDGLSVVTDVHRVKRRIGYCPQFDGLNPSLTVLMINKIRFQTIFYNLLRCLQILRYFYIYLLNIIILYSAAEHIRYYAKLRGVEKTKINHVIDWVLAELNLDEFRNIPAGQYSGGNKRKLSTAIAFTGAPDVILLDEPTG